MAAFDARHFGKKLVSIRQQRELDQARFAHCTGIPVLHLKLLEVGEWEPSAADIKALSSAFKVPQQYIRFLGKTPPPKKSPTRMVHEATVFAICDAIAGQLTEC